MNSPLIHGCYDSNTLETLKNFGVNELSFDLRGRSPNLITFKDLTSLLPNLQSEKLFLTFENDRKETILSYLNILGARPFNFSLIFRDNLPATFYEGIGQPFFWMYDPDGDWKSILSLSSCKGVLLPIKYQGSYQRSPELWELIEKKNLTVYLHAENFEQTAFMNLSLEIKLSLDLSPEVEAGFRKVDQEKLKKMKIWRKLNENSASQR